MRNPHADDQVGAFATNGSSQVVDTAFAGVNDAGNTLENGGLAGAIGTKDGRYGALLDTEGDAPKGLHRTIGRFQVLDLEHGISHYATSSRVPR